MWYNLLTDEQRANTEFVINLSYAVASCNANLLACTPREDDFCAWAQAREIEAT